MSDASSFEVSTVHGKPAAPRDRRWPAELAVIALYAVSFFIETYPLVRHFASGIVGGYESDAPIFLWNAWEWDKKFRAADFSFSTTDVLYPHASSLLLHTHTMVDSSFAAAINAVTGNLALSFNIVFLLTGVAAAYFAYRFFYLMTKNRVAAFLAGQFFAFQHLWAVYVLFGTRNLTSLWYLPAALCAAELRRQKKLDGFSAALGLVAALAFLDDFIIFVFTVFSVALYSAIMHLMVRRQELRDWIRQIAISGLAFFAIAGWKIHLLAVSATGVRDIAVPTTQDVDFYHADIINLLRPAHFHALWGNLSTLFRDASLTNGNDFIGFAFLLVLATALIIRSVPGQAMKNGRMAAAFALLAGTALLMSFGPYLHIWGWNTGIPMPHYFLNGIWPQFNNLRVPLRWLFVAMLFLGGVLACLLDYVLQFFSRRIRPIVAGAIYALLLLDVFFWPKNIIPVTQGISPIYQTMAQDPAGSVLELPMAIGSGYFTLGADGSIAMLHQTIHHHPIIGGSLSRLPFSLKDSYRA
ncbi:MAG: hypothetical protein AAB692_06225, partial [Patescibacteria group bacterium]